MSQKTCHPAFVHNFGKCSWISKVLSLLNSARNLLKHGDIGPTLRTAHLKYVAWEIHNIKDSKILVYLVQQSQVDDVEQTTMCFKNRTPKTDRHNFVKVCPLRMIFYRKHRHLIADWLRLKSLIKVDCQLLVSMATTAPCWSAQLATWLNWSSDWLRSRLTSNWPSLIGPLTIG